MRGFTPLSAMAGASTSCPSPLSHINNIFMVPDWLFRMQDIFDSVHLLSLFFVGIPAAYGGMRSRNKYLPRPPFSRPFGFSLLDLSLEFWFTPRLFTVGRLFRLWHDSGDLFGSNWPMDLPIHNLPLVQEHFTTPPLPKTSGPWRKATLSTLHSCISYSWSFIGSIYPMVARHVHPQRSP